ncbi:hypothetical protein M0802_002333 [Mischocyttarus mexicanus]|nr:hypothetical protein M0802_002333 [Mischocyttarus mexicanus]
MLPMLHRYDRLIQLGVVIREENQDATALPMTYLSEVKKVSGTTLAGMNYVRPRLEIRRKITTGFHSTTPLTYF